MKQVQEGLAKEGMYYQGSNGRYGGHPTGEKLSRYL
jgi:hypothetical protein